MGIRKKGYVLLFGFTVAWGSGCSKPMAPSVPFGQIDTGSPLSTHNPTTEQMQSDGPKEDLQVGDMYFVQVPQLNYWSEKGDITKEPAGTLPLNTQLQLVSKDRSPTDPSEKGDWIEARVSQLPPGPHGDLKVGDLIWVNYKYLDSTPQSEEANRIPTPAPSPSPTPSPGPHKPTPPAPAPVKNFKGVETFSPTQKPGVVTDVFMIQNIATEMGRVYKRVCEVNQCRNELVFESSMVAGEDEDDRRTVLGNFVIRKWTKFYQDGAVNYPSWYDPNYPPLPEPGSSGRAWLSRSLLPKINGERHGAVRGAFGWYTALVSPNPFNQWTHGTTGWGSDGDKFIRIVNGWFLNLISDPRSHGCSRYANPNIAAIRQILPLGSTILKIYAKEKLMDAPMGARTFSWDWILTNEGVREDGRKSDRTEVLAADVPRSRWLEEGTFVVDQTPTPQDGNLYDIKSSHFRGTFWVDRGVVTEYSHPGELTVGGRTDERLPPAVILGTR